MPSMTSAVGGLTLPIAAGGANSALLDPVVVGLASFLGWSIRNDLNTKLAEITGMAVDACPVANVYTQDPTTSFVRRGFPALYLWWGGPSKWTQDTLVYSRRERTLSVAYFYAETVDPVGIQSRGGIIGAVDACFCKASDRGRHSSYAPTGYPAGTDLRTALGLLQWQYVGAQKVELAAEIPATSTSPGGAPEGVVKRGYPCLLAQFVVWERVQPDTLEDPADVAKDVLVELETSELGGDTVAIHSGYLVAPDGSEVDSGEEDTGTIPNTFDTTAPVVSNWTPADPNLDSFDSFGFDVTDNHDLDSLSIELFQYTTDVLEPVYVNGVFVAPYLDSVRTDIEDGYHFDIVRTDGWPGFWIYPTIDVADVRGNAPAIAGDWYQPVAQHGVTHEFATVPAPDVDPPTIDNFSPVSHIVAPGDPISFDVRDFFSNAFLTTIAVNYGAIPSEPALFEGDFLGPFVTSSTTAAASLVAPYGTKYTLIRDGDWPVGLTSVDVYAEDLSGNIATETFYFTVTA